MTANRSLPFGLVIACLLILGGILYYAINQVSSEMPATGPAGARAGALHGAAEKGDVAGIEAQLKRGVPVDQARDTAGGRKGETALMAAAYSGQAGAIRALLKGGAQPNARASDGKTALMFAAGWGNLDTVRALLESAARPNDRSEERLTALMLAAGRGQADCLQALLDAGAEVNAKNKWGQTALMLAARAGDAAKVKALLAASATVNDADLDGTTAVNFAAGAEGSAGALEALIAARADLSVADGEGVTPLMRAADKGDSDKIMILLSAGAKTGPADKQGRKAIDWARARSDAAGDAAAKLLEEAARRSRDGASRGRERPDNRDSSQAIPRALTIAGLCCRAWSWAYSPGAWTHAAYLRRSHSTLPGLMRRRHRRGRARRRRARESTRLRSPRRGRPP